MILNWKSRNAATPASTLTEADGPISGLAISSILSPVHVLAPHTPDIKMNF